MSTIWTPGGEYTPKPEPPPGPAQGPPTGPLPEYGGTEEELAAEAARVREQILTAPVLDLVANHAIGLFEVAALHLGSERPRFDEVRLAIDAMAALVDGLGERLGRHEPVLRDALSQLQLAFVQAQSQSPTP